MVNNMNALRLTATLGLVPHLCRNFLMGLGSMPKDLGSHSEALMGLFALGTVLISHPFEVARVLMVQNEGGKLVPTLRALY